MRMGEIDFKVTESLENEKLTYNMKKSRKVSKRTPFSRMD